MYSLRLNKYYNADSLIHNVNPLCKIICSLIFTFLCLYSSNITFLLIMLLFAILVFFISNVPLKLYLNNLKFILPMLVFIFIINLIFSNIYITILTILKLLLFVFYSQILLYTTKPNDLTYGLEIFLSPLKIFNLNVSSLALTISLSLRFIPIVFNEAYKVLKSQISRGLNFSGDLNKKSQSIISVIIPVLALSLKRSEEISYVLDMRLYRINGERTKYKMSNFCIIDESILCIHILLILICLFFEVIV